MPRRRRMPAWTCEMTELFSKDVLPDGRPGNAVLPESIPDLGPEENPPSVWVLADHKLGHTTQSVALADQLGWPYELKELSFNRLRRLSNFWLGATTLSLDRGLTAPLVPPWPDLVIATGRASAPIARWIKAQSSNRTRIVQLGRRGTDQRAGAFDLSVTCGFFGLPSHSRRIETLAPIAAIHDLRLRAAGERWRELFADAPHPHVALLVGGATKAHLLDAAGAERMAREVLGFVHSAGGTLQVVTSPRTGGKISSALRAGLADGTRFYEWKRADPDNPYLGCLAVADILVVTGDSESMIAEAAGTTKPLYIYSLPARAQNRRRRIRAWVGARALPQHAPAGRPSQGIQKSCALLLKLGIVRPPRRLNELHRQLMEGGYARRFGDPLDASPRAALSEVEGVAARVRLMMGRTRATAESGL